MNRTIPVLLASLGLSTGCTELIPTVAFDRFDVHTLTWQEIDTDFVFRVDNPNPIQIDLTDYAYQLELQQVPVLSGENLEGFTLEAEGGSELALPVGLVFTEAWDLVEATRGEDTIDFGIEGDFGFDTPVGQAEIPFHETGDFPAVRTPNIRLDALRVGQLDVLSGEADFEIDLAVDNAHGSSLWFDSFTFDVGLGGSDVVAGSLPTLGAVEGAAEEILVLPITANLLNAGTSVIDALLNQEPLTVQLSASTDVETPFGVLPLQINEEGQVSVE